MYVFAYLYGAWNTNCAFVFSLKEIWLFIKGSWKKLNYLRSNQRLKKCFKKGNPPKKKRKKLSLFHTNGLWNGTQPGNSFILLFDFHISVKASSDLKTIYNTFYIVNRATQLRKQAAHNLLKVSCHVKWTWRDYPHLVSVSGANNCASDLRHPVPTDSLYGEIIISITFVGWFFLVDIP